MQFRLGLLLASIVLATALAGCTQKPSTNDGTTDSDTKVVDMKNLAFAPKDVTIKVGQKIKWTNSDSLPHDVTPKGNTTAWNMTGKGGIPPGGEFTKTFTEAGVYEYYCQEHGSGMSGKVTVTA